jgi:hypothetical protein
MSIAVEANQPDADRNDDSISRIPNSQRRRELSALRSTLVIVVLLWTFLYNLLIKGQDPSQAFFRILDTISDDLVLGAVLTVGVGLGIVAVFSATKLYTQIVANVFSFRIIEKLVFEELAAGHTRRFFARLVSLENEPQPATTCPRRVSFILLSLAFLYVMSWVYIVLFSEALFFVSWSAGVDLPLGDPERMLLLPTLALAIPFSARVMAYLRYPYAQDYADFMPGAAFVLLVVASLGAIFESDDQKFFLLQVWSSRDYLITFLKNGVLLAFVPVFFEAGYWLVQLTKEERLLPLDSKSGESLDRLTRRGSFNAVRRSRDSHWSRRSHRHSKTCTRAVWSNWIRVVHHGLPRYCFSIGIFLLL